MFFEVEIIVGVMTMVPMELAILSRRPLCRRGFQFRWPFEGGVIVDLYENTLRNHVKNGIFRESGYESVSFLLRTVGRVPISIALAQST